MRFLPIFLLLTACATGKNQKPESWLFVQNAERAEIHGKKLTLTGVGPTVICFTDRPERKTGTIPTEKFLTGWTKKSGVFVEDPPNATLSIFGADGVSDLVVVLRNPKLDGRTLTYDIEVLEGKPGPSGPAALFIDSVGSGNPVIRHGMHDEPGVIVRRGMHLVR